MLSYENKIGKKEKGMFKMKLIVLAGVLLLLSGCSSKSDYQLFQTTDRVIVEKEIPNRRVEYKILPQDRLAINIYKYPELAPTSMTEKGILVDSRGYISLPLIHRVKIAGLTQTQAARMLERKYKVYLTDPTLNLEVLNKRIYVLGEVNKPGVVKLDREKLTVIEAVALAADFTDSAVRDNIIIISHNSQNKMIMRKVDMTSFKSMNLANLMVKPNDIIYVQPNKWKSFKVASDDVTSVLDPILKVVGTYATFKYLVD